MYYKQIKLMDGDKIRVSPAEAAVVEKAVLGGAKHTKVRGIVIAISSISRIDDTDESMEEFAALPNGLPKNSAPLPGRWDNSVSSTYVKREVNHKEYDRIMAKSGSVKVLNRYEGSLTIARTHVKRQDGSVPEGWELVDKDEFERLVRM